MPEARFARDDDVGALVDLMAEFYRESDYALDRDGARVAFARLLSTPEIGCVWLLTSEGELAGYVAMTLVFSMEFQGVAAFLDDLFVRPGYRGRGLGGLAVATLLEEARRRGVKAVHVECSTEDTAAVRLYRRAGFADRMQGRQILTMNLAASER